MTNNTKQAAQEFIEQLPDSVTWNDLLYQLYTKQKIQEGLSELDEGLGISHEEAEHRLLSNLHQP